MTEHLEELRERGGDGAGFVSIQVVRELLDGLILREITELIVLDLTRGRIQVDGVDHSLTSAETSVLTTLVAAAGAVVGRAELAASVEKRPRPGLRAVDAVVSQLRAKLAPHDNLIASHYRAGYSIALATDVTVRRFAEPS